MKGSMFAHNSHWKRVEQLVRKYDAHFGQTIFARKETRSSRLEMSFHGSLDAFLQRRRVLRDVEVHRAEEIRELLFGPVQNVAGKVSAPGTLFEHQKRLRRAHQPPHLMKLPGQQSPEHCVHVARCVEVSRLSELRRIPPVVSEFPIVETHLHVGREGNRLATPAD